MSEVENVNDQNPELEEKKAKSQWFKMLREQFGPGAPDEAMVEAWKKQCGRVRVVSFGTEEVYFYRPLRSSEYKGIVQQVLAAKGDQQLQNELLKERLVAVAVLWPKIDPTSMGALFAGTKDSLYMMIMEASNFVTPEQVEVMVREL